MIIEMIKYLLGHDTVMQQKEIEENWDHLRDERENVSLEKQLNVVVENSKFVVIKDKNTNNIYTYPKLKNIKFSYFSDPDDPFALYEIMIDKNNKLFIDNPLENISSRNDDRNLLTEPVDKDKVPDEIKDKIIKEQI